MEVEVGIEGGTERSTPSIPKSKNCTDTELVWSDIGAAPKLELDEDIVPKLNEEESDRKQGTPAAKTVVARWKRRYIRYILDPPHQRDLWRAGSLSLHYLAMIPIIVCFLWG